MSCVLNDYGMNGLGDFMGFQGIKELGRLEAIEGFKGTRA